jgi:hypothetical protein
MILLGLGHLTLRLRFLAEASGWTLVNAAVASVFVAELVHHGVAVRSCRRGSGH